MRGDAAMDALPEYEHATLRMVERQRLAEGFARQLALTTGPRLDRPFDECRVVDLGCGYGHTMAELSKLCRDVVGMALRRWPELWAISKSLLVVAKKHHSR